MASSPSRIIDLIQQSPEASGAVKRWSITVRNTLAILRQPISNDLDRIVEHAVGSYIHAAVSRAADRHSPSDRRHTGREERLPSQFRIQLIKELEDLAAFFAKPRGHRYIRSRKVISRFAISLLLRQEGFGNAIMSPLDENAFGRDDDGGQSVIPPSDPDTSSVPTLHGPRWSQQASTLTGEPVNDAALVFRTQAWSARRGDATGAMRIDPVSDLLPPEVEAKLSAVVALSEGRGHVDLRTLEGLLTEVEDGIMASCFRQSVELLEVTFGIGGRQGFNVQSGQTLHSFRSEPPLGRFIYAVFELLAPTHDDCSRGALSEWPLDEVLFHFDRQRSGKRQGLTADGLPDLVKHVTLSGLTTAQDVALICFGADSIDLNIDAGLMEMTEDIAKNLKGSDDGMSFSEPEKNDDDVEHRTAEGQRRSVDRMWRLRQSWLILRGYAVFFGWYKRALMRAIFNDHLQKYMDFEQCIYREVEQQAVEMGIRYVAGQIQKAKEGEKRINGRPLPIWRLPAASIVRRPAFIDYPGEGVGAYPDETVLAALLKLIAKEHPQAPEVWRSVVALVDPSTLIETLRRDEERASNEPKDPTRAGV